MDIRSRVGIPLFHEAPETCCSSKDIAGLIDADSEISTDETRQDSDSASDVSQASSEDDASEDFQQFLRLAQMQPGLLPDCCTRDRCYACEKLAMDQSEPNSIYNPLTTSQAINFYVRIYLRYRLV